ncbi:MAG: hypothetical protein SFU86_21630 [Pirellulaceae bacterium]|nr:hypothetical protein [Pirellulaceae bacterium]
MARGCWLLAVLTVAFVGCNPAAPIVGKWEIDAAAPTAPTDNPLAAAMAAGMLAMLKVDVEFKADNTCSMTGQVLGQSLQKTGKWRYVKTDGDALVLMVHVDGDPNERELRVKVIDAEHLEMIPPAMSATPSPAAAYRFKRVKPT